jgi:hypothetical protein
VVIYKYYVQKVTIGIASSRERDYIVESPSTFRELSTQSKFWGTCRAELGQSHWCLGLKKYKIVNLLASQLVFGEINQQGCWFWGSAKLMWKNTGHWGV